MELSVRHTLRSVAQTLTFAATGIALCTTVVNAASNATTPGELASTCFEQVTIKGNYVAGIAACSELISLSKAPGSTANEIELAAAYDTRALAYGAVGKREQAIADYTHAVQLAPRMANAYSSRGLLYHYAGAYKQAKADFETALRIAPENLGGYNNMAWMYATASDPAYRDGTKAVNYAVEAVALMRVPPTLDTMAAAYVESGNFNEAINLYEEAMERGGKARVKIYQTDLKRKGHYDGELHGRYSIATRKALHACVNAGDKMGVN